MKLREIFLVEAAYDGMIVSMKKTFPDYASAIDERVAWAKSSLKKADRVVWYLRILQATLVDMRDGSNTADALYGNYFERDLQNLQDHLLHYYGFNSPDINKYQFGKQTVEQVFSDFNSYEDKWIAKQNLSKPISPEEGDYELIKFPDGSAWWFVDRGYCPEEGRSGGHCGNVNGQYNTDERILSYRIGGHVVLTFILHPDGYLGEMKAKNNQKPAEKYHNVIMSLLLSGTVLGIKGAGYLPEMNFSIFDLNEKNLNVIISNKPSFIADQISATPIEFLKAPSIIRANPEYRQLAASSLPAIAPLLNGESNENWEAVIKMNPDLIINAPNTIDYFRERVIERLADKPKLILQSPRSIGRDSELLKEVVTLTAAAITYIVPTTPNYKELAIIAVNKEPRVLKFVPAEFRDYDICMTAVKKAGNAIELVPSTLSKYYDICLEAVKNHADALGAIEAPTDPKDLAIYKKICLVSVQNYGDALYNVPLKLRDYDICMAAVKNSGISIRFIPRQELFDASTKEKYKELFLAAVKQDSEALRLIPPNDIDFDISLAAVKSDKGFISSLNLIPRKFRKYSLCLEAVKVNAWQLKHVPPPIIEYYDDNNEYATKIDEKAFKSYKKICIVALKKDGKLLDVIPGNLRDYDICFEAVKQNGQVLYYVPTVLRDYKMCVEAVKQNRAALHHVPDKLKAKVEAEYNQYLASKNKENKDDQDTNFLFKTNWFDEEN